MSRSKTYTVKLKRKRKGKTDYARRITYLKSGKVRIVIRLSLNNTMIQAITFKDDGDATMSTISSKELRKLGWKYHLGNLPSAYLIGLYFGIKNKNKIKEAIIDLGLRRLIKGDRLSATIKGIIDSGLNIPHSEEIYPKDDRINGSNIVEYAKKLSSNKELFDKQFSKYLKDGANPEKITEDFEKIKAKILSEK